MTINANNLELSNTLLLLKELRTRLFRSLIVFFLIWAMLSYFANDLYGLLAWPFLKLLPQGHFIATDIISPFFVPFKLACVLAICLSAPFFLYQWWAFIAPALYGHERKMIWPLLLASTLLFYLGIAFAYFIILPMLFHFIAQITPKNVLLSPDIGEYFDFTIKFMLVFGVLFEIPMIMLLLTWLGVVGDEAFAKMRPYAIVGAFVLGMLLAPPDVLSQTLLAVPICLLYEMGIRLAKMMQLKRRRMM